MQGSGSYPYAASLRLGSSIAALHCMPEAAGPGHVETFCGHYIQRSMF